MGARLASGLHAAIKSGGCRHLWSLTVTLDDFDSDFLNTPRTVAAAATASGHRRTSSSSQRSGNGSNNGVSREGGLTPGQGVAGNATVDKRRAPFTPIRTAAHPMNALALARAFHPRAPGGGVGALLNADRREAAASGRSGQREQRALVGARRGAITSLALSYARLHPRSVEELAAHAIASLTHLDLSHCYIGPAGALALARALDGSAGAGVGGGVGGCHGHGRGSRSLRSLTLPHNAVGDLGARVLGQALATNRCLTFLSLASNGIGPAGGQALASALRGGGVVLSRLDVGGNPLGDKASRMLVAAAAAASATSAAARGDGGGVGGGDGMATAVDIVGLDRVAGATVGTRGAMRCAASSTRRCATSGRDEGRSSVGVGGERGEGRACAVAFNVDEQVSVRSEDAVGRDEFVQVQ